ncbi:MAG: glutaredoxin family protein [Candidatus Anammoxibacter sp.]
MQKWRCEHCGYEYDGDILELCPSCKESCGFIDATNYVPESFNGNEGRPKDMANVEVKVYCDPFCPSCKDIGELLKEKGVDFTYVDVNKDENAMKEATSISGQDKLPVIKIGETVMVPPIDTDKLLEAINN